MRRIEDRWLVSGTLKSGESIEVELQQVFYKHGDGTLERVFEMPSKKIVQNTIGECVEKLSMATRIPMEKLGVVHQKDQDPPGIRN